jgi:hypothetical protein
VQHIWIAGDYAFSCDGPDSDDDNVTDWFPDGLPAVGSLALCLFNLRVLDEPITEMVQPETCWVDEDGADHTVFDLTVPFVVGDGPTVVDVDF